MRILVIADIDDFHWKYGTGQADIILSCGDVVDKVIMEAAEAYDCKAIFAVKGNHDRNTPFEEPIIDLHMQSLNYGNYSFGGFNGAWRYKNRGHFLYDQKQAEEMLSELPPVDIFLSHNSPLGIHDKTDGIHYGFSGLNYYIVRTHPSIVIHGHQHVDRASNYGSTKVMGVYQHKILEI